MSSRRVLSLLAAVVLALLASAAPARGDTYVALGDSYAAGPGIPLPIKPWGCLKSDHNYAHLVAPELGLELRDPSCSGAETEDMTEPQGVWPEPNPPQFDQLTAEAKVVTLIVGGNDIGFSSIARSCGSATPEGTPCRDQWVVDGEDEVSRRIAEAAPKVAKVIQDIHAKAPAATVAVLNYPTIFPDEGDGCFPQIPVTPGDVHWLRAKHKELNRMIADQAAANGARLVDWYTASIGHDACQPPGFKWVEGLVPMSGVAPIHPNLLGMIAAADLVADGVGA